jgi:HlyD family secretion protein
MDIQRPSNARAKKIRSMIYVAIAVISVAGVTFGVARLRPAAPSVDKGTLLTGEVKRGPMLREVLGLGTLVPEEIHWIPARTDSRVDRIVVHPGTNVQPSTVILELSNPELQRDVLDAEYQLKAGQADYENLKVQVNSELLNQRPATAQVRSDYEQAKLQHEVDEKLFAQGLRAEVTAQLYLR